MKQLSIIIIMSLSISVSGQNLMKKFFSPIPKLTQKDFAPATKSEWRPIISLPALKIIQSTRKDAQIDALLLTSTGGGISWQKLKLDNTTNKWNSVFSVSPLTILLSGNLTATNPIDISYATTLGFFNNLLMIGGGYDLGTVTGRSRFFGLLSIGVNLNN